MRKYEALVTFRAVVFADDEHDAWEAIHAGVTTHELPHIVETFDVNVEEPQLLD